MLELPSIQTYKLWCKVVEAKLTVKLMISEIRTTYNCSKSGALKENIILK